MRKYDGGWVERGEQPAPSPPATFCGLVRLVARIAAVELPVAIVSDVRLNVRRYLADWRDFAAAVRDDDQPRYGGEQ